MRTLLRTALAPLLVGALLLGCVSFAVATGHQTVPKAPDKVYPCIPDHTGGHGGDYGNWQTWWQWLKQKYGDKWANDVQAKYGSALQKYVADKYSGNTTTTTFGGGGHHPDPDDCEPECPDGKAGSMTTSTYGGNHGGNNDDECCPPKPHMSSYSTSTYGGNHGGDHEDECEPEKPGCGPDKTGGVAGGSGYHSGQPPKDDDRGDCPDTDCKASAATQTTSPHGSSSHSHNKCDPPTVNTGGCSGCKASSMTITGTVDPMGSATYYKFEYGSTPAFGMETDWESAGDGIDPKSVSETIDGLAPGTKIYYRLVAKNVRGTTNGGTRYCMTAAAAKPSAVTGGTSSLRSTTVTLGGSVDANGASTTAYFEYGKTSSLGTKTGSQGVGSGDEGKSVSAGLGGLKANTKYYYRVVASNSKGSASGSVLSFTTSR